MNDAEYNAMMQTFAVIIARLDRIEAAVQTLMPHDEIQSLMPVHQQPTVVSEPCMIGPTVAELNDP